MTLMTLHNAKGLEFPIVFIIGMEDGMFPHSRAIEEGNIEEERRLAYVGLTRAMRDLTLTYARRRNSYGGGSTGLRSRFLDELPRELTDQARADRAGFPAPGRSRRGQARRGRGRGRRRGASSASATTSCTPRSARAWSRRRAGWNRRRALRRRLRGP